jgi:hypothetical protein
LAILLGAKELSEFTGVTFGIGLSRSRPLDQPIRLDHMSYAYAGKEHEECDDHHQFPRVPSGVAVEGYHAAHFGQSWDLGNRAQVSISPNMGNGTAPVRQALHYARRLDLPI